MKVICWIPISQAPLNTGIENVMKSFQVSFSLGNRHNSTGAHATKLRNVHILVNTFVAWNISMLNSDVQVAMNSEFNVMAMMGSR